MTVYSKPSVSIGIREDNLKKPASLLSRCFKHIILVLDSENNYLNYPGKLKSHKLY